MSFRLEAPVVPPHCSGHVLLDGAAPTLDALCTPRGRATILFRPCSRACCVQGLGSLTIRLAAVQRSTETTASSSSEDLTEIIIRGALSAPRMPVARAFSNIANNCSIALYIRHAVVQVALCIGPVTILTLEPCSSAFLERTVRTTIAAISAEVSADCSSSSSEGDEDHSDAEPNEVALPSLVSGRTFDDRVADTCGLTGAYAWTGTKDRSRIVALRFWLGGDSSVLGVQAVYAGSAEEEDGDTNLCPARGPKHVARHAVAASNVRQVNVQMKTGEFVADIISARCDAYGEQECTPITGVNIISTTSRVVTVGRVRRGIVDDSMYSNEVQQQQESFIHQNAAARQDVAVAASAIAGVIAESGVLQLRAVCNANSVERVLCVKQRAEEVRRREEITAIRNRIDAMPLSAIRYALYASERERAQIKSQSDEQRACRICCQRLINCVLVNCGHAFLCDVCAHTLLHIHRQPPTCPICNAPIQSVQIAFFDF